MKTARRFTVSSILIRDPLLFDLWKDQGIDTMVHLAFIVDPIHDVKKMYDVNVNGTLNVLRICEELNSQALIQHFNLVAVALAYQNR